MIWSFHLGVLQVIVTWSSLLQWWYSCKGPAGADLLLGGAALMR
jgi:hypothetical protein